VEVVEVLWEELTSEELGEAAKSGLIAVLPIGSLEKHGPHAPLGTDTLTVFNLARLAAEREPAVVLPPLYYAMVKETRHFPGAVSLSAETLLRVLGEVCDEVSRNGFKKILIVNGHGGNAETLRSFTRDRQLSRGVDYVVYILAGLAPALSREEMEEITEGRLDGHGGIRETSLGLYFYPRLIKLERVKGEGRIGSLGLPRHIFTPLEWPARAPEVYIGDPRHASAEKGRVLAEGIVDSMAEAIRAIRQDERTPAILGEFQRSAYGP